MSSLFTVSKYSMDLSFRNWIESTTPYVEKVVDPALMTTQEYIRMLDPGNKAHCDTAYKISLKDRYQPSREDFSQLINHVEFYGIKFEIRMNELDRAAPDRKYVKMTPKGEPVLDEKGNSVYLTQEEKEQRFANRRYDYSIGVFTKEDGYIGGVHDEWGCMLYQIVDEYQGMGIGSYVAELARKYMPDKPSGGFTSSGYRTIQKVHAKFVRDYMSSGMYSHLVKTGQITPQRVKQIIGSIVAPSKKREPRDFSSNDPKNWLFYVDEPVVISSCKKYYRVFLTKA